MLLCKKMYIFILFNIGSTFCEYLNLKINLFINYVYKFMFKFTEDGLINIICKSD